MKSWMDYSEEEKEWIDKHFGQADEIVFYDGRFKNGEGISFKCAKYFSPIELLKARIIKGKYD